MVYFLKIEKWDNMKDTNRSNTSIKLSSIIILMFITAIVSGLTAGIIVYTSYNKNTGIKYEAINNDAALKQFLEVYSSVTTDYYEEVNKTEMIEAAIDGMLKYLDDRYTSYMNVDQTTLLNNSLLGEYKGIGIVVVGHEVSEVFNDSPAKKAGILVGDVITHVNNESVENISPEEMVKKIKNSSGTISITVMRAGEEMSFELTTSKLYVPAISYKVIDNTSIGYLRLATFSSTLSNQVEDALDELNENNISALVIDVRGNTGGYLKAAEDVCSLFIEKGKVIYSLKTKQETVVVKDRTEKSTKFPIIVLIDENTASAAEILASALKESYGATLVGNKSYGKGKVQQVISLVDGSMAKYTTGKWYTPSDENIDKIGIEPDYKVDLEFKKDENGRIVDIVDTQLSRAVELLMN